ncbi:MAG: hypothetical protein JWO38_6777 [Gemmataceae bacterium]|nr:hypothetical protein [Gemmataceae bacterium]
MSALAPRRRLSLLIVRVPAVLLLALAPGLARAADPKPAETALGKVPADAEFFRSALRLGETVETIGQSRVWKQLWNEPEVQELWKKARAAYETGDGGLAAVRQFFADPANKDLPGLAADALSHEVFVYAGSGTGDLIALFQELAGGARYGPAFQKLLGDNPDDPTRTRVRIVLQSLAEKPERLKVPDLVIGFKVSDPAKVSAQLKRIDPLLADALKDTPLKGRSERVKVDGDEFLVLKLDGSLVPWDKVPLEMFEDKPGEFAPLTKHLKEMKLTVAVGVRQGYLLVAITESVDRLAKFGGAGPKVAGRPELKPLEKVAGRPLTAVGYTSQALRAATATTPEDITGWADLAKAAAQKADLPDADQKALEKDIDALAQAIARGLTKPGAAVNFSVRTARGWETFDYDYTTPGPGEPRPLTLLNHLGGDPLLAAVWRSGTTVEDYRAFAKWVAVFAGHAETIALAKVPDAEETIKTVRKEVVPLVKQLGDVTEKLWLPALADGQEGVVLDAKWASKRWHASLPEADRELPLPELGVVLGVSDPAKLGQALEGYRVLANKMIAKARELDPSGKIPAFEIPKPRVEQKGGRTFAYYPIPEEWGIDRQFRPTGGLSGKVAALTLSREHTERLLAESPLQTGLAPFADLKRPLESAFYVNWAGVVEATGPWVGYLIRSVVPEDKREKAERVAVKVMGVLKVFRSYGSVTYREGGATVTHSEAVFGDIEPEAGK